MAQITAQTNFDGGTEFSEITFQSVNAKGKDLSDFRFENCQFINCAFTEGSLNQASFLECKFQDCDLSNVKIRGARFRDVIFLDSKLVGLNWASTSAVADLKFHQCLMSYSVFTGLDLRLASFEESTLRECDFADANISKAIFRGSDLSGTRFSNTDLREADFRQATNFAIRAEENKIKKAKFSMPEATALLYGLGIDIEA